MALTPAIAQVSSGDSRTANDNDIKQTTKSVMHSSVSRGHSYYASTASDGLEAVGGSMAALANEG